MNLLKLLIILLCISCQTDKKMDCVKETFHSYYCVDVDYVKWEEFRKKSRPFRGDN